MHIQMGYCIFYTVMFVFITHTHKRAYIQMGCCIFYTFISVLIIHTHKHAYIQMGYYIFYTVMSVLLKEKYKFGPNEYANYFAFIGLVYGGSQLFSVCMSAHKYVYAYVCVWRIPTLFGMYVCA